MPEIADDEPLPLDMLARFADEERSWVAVDATGRPVGYVVVDVVDRCAHVEQVSVGPDHQGAGIGRKLLDDVKAWAAANGCAGVTLTTLRDCAPTLPRSSANDISSVA